VLPDRIELSTSPLPMECSTTELRQRARTRESAKRPPTRRADPCHKAPFRASTRAARGTLKLAPKSALSARGLLQLGQLRADPVPHFLTQRLQRLDGADHDLEFDHFAGLIEFDEIDAL
jgi:hypothetical protein